MVPHPKEAGFNASIHHGRTITIFPHVRHRALLKEGGGPCKVVYLHLDSGDYTGDDLQEWLVTEYDNLIDEPIRQASPDRLSKRVFLREGVVPGLFQFSIARYAPGAVCTEHSHPTASEIYINYFGPGCHLQWEEDLQGKKDLLGNPFGERKHNMDLSGGKVAVLGPGTRHSAWNSQLDQACWVVNALVGNPKDSPMHML
jgi:hypothetical protein